MDLLMINDLQYTGEVEGTNEGAELEKGEVIGEVEYKMADNACSNHKMRNGDAAFLPAGTEIYSIKGYDADFRVLADDKVYQISENPKAQTLADLYDIEGKVDKISIESIEDGSHISDFTPMNTNAFIEEYLSLEYTGIEGIEKKRKNSSRTFIRIHLNDGTSFRTTYYISENVLNPGAYGTEKMKNIMLEETKRARSD